MKTTEQWWNEVSQSEDLMVNWLKAQYHGEVTAENRIREMISTYNITDSLTQDLISMIADDEKRHALWVKGLLVARGLTAEVLQKEERYWNETLPQVDKEQSFTYMCAVAHLAETMRLDRINLLASDSRYEDITKVFAKILPDEKYHAKIFSALSTTEDIAKAKEFHTNGMNAIGLVA